MEQLLEGHLVAVGDPGHQRGVGTVANGHTWPDAVTRSMV
jgi:hypothetical protein